jgi:hypothetical protein
MSRRIRSDFDDVGPGSAGAATVGGAPYGGAFDMAGQLAASANAFRSSMGAAPAPPTALHAHAVQAVQAQEAQRRAAGLRKQAMLVAIAQSMAGRNVPGSAGANHV